MSHSSWNRALLWLVVFAPAALPQAPTSFPLEILRVQGNSRIPAGKILGVAGLKLGALVDKPDFDAARARLIATGGFLSVGYEYKPAPSKKGYEGVFEVVEIDQLFPYRVEDLPVSEKIVRETLAKQEPLFGDRIPGTPEVLSRYAKTIGQIAKVDVIGKVNSDVPGELTIIFRPPAARSNIAEVRFTGNQVLPSSLLVNTLSGVAIGVPYNEAMLRLLLDSSIRPLYEARGRIRATFPAIAVEKSTKPDVDGVVTTIDVNEGESYSLGSVRFAGVSTADARELETAGKFKIDDVANFDEIKAGLERIYGRYRNKGYVHVTGRVDRQIHDEEHKVDLAITIDPGLQYAMGKLEISGLDIQSEPAIRKVWLLKAGEPFQPEYPESFLNDIRAQGVFENLGKTSSESKIDEKSRTVNVTLFFAGSAGKDQTRGGPKP